MEEMDLLEEGLELPDQREESLKDFIENVLNEDSISKEELRNRWMKNKSKRDQLVKKRNKAKDQVKLLLTKIKMFEEELNKHLHEELEEMREKMIANCMKDV